MCDEKRKQSRKGAKDLIVDKVACHKHATLCHVKNVKLYYYIFEIKSLNFYFGYISGFSKPFISIYNYLYL